MGIEEFLLYRAEKQGIEKGIKQGVKQGENSRSHAFVKKLIDQTTFPDERIADLADVSVSFVQRVRKELKTDCQ